MISGITIIDKFGLPYYADDFGVKDSNTIGSIMAGSPYLRVSSDQGFSVNDTIIIETGGEATFNSRAGGTRGTKGMRTWPQLSYASFDEMQNDTVGKSNNLRAWCEDTGQTATFSTTTNLWTLSNPGFYYDAYAIPQAFRARIIAIGIIDDLLTFTLNRTPNVGSIGANVYFDNAYIISKLCIPFNQTQDISSYPLYSYIDMTGRRESRKKVIMPEGNFAVGEQLLLNRPGMCLKGAGIDKTVIFSPKGTSCFNLKVGSSNTLIEGFTFKGNARKQGYGSHWETWQQAESLVTGQTDSFKVPEGVIYQSSVDSVARTCKVIDIFWTAFGSRSSTNLHRENIEIYRNDPMMMYIQWQMQDAGGNNCGWVKCKFESDWITKVFESFNSTGSYFIDCHFKNGLGSMNNGANFTVKNCTQLFTHNSRPDDINILEPCFNQNFNAGTGATGGLIENHQITIEDYLDADNNLLPGITMQPASSGITIKGGFYHAPNWSGPSIKPGPVGIINSGNNIIDGFEVTGTVNTFGETRADRCNIGMSKGTIKNCVAPYMVVQVPPVTVGTGSEANAGAIAVVS